MNRFHLRRVMYRNDSPPVVPPVVPPPPPPAGKFYTQDEINAMMANNRKTQAEELKKTVTMLEEAKTAKGLTEQQVADLQARIDNLTQQNMSELDRLKTQLEKTKTETTNQLTAEQKRAAEAEKRFNDLMINHSILEASTVHGAASATQMQAMFGHQAKVTQKVDSEGNNIPGEFMVKLPVEISDGKKGTTKVELSVTEAFEKYRDNPNFQNLFNAKGKQGLGGSNVPKTSNGTPDFANMEPEEFMKYRAEQKKATK